MHKQCCHAMPRNSPNSRKHSRDKMDKSTEMGCLTFRRLLLDSGGFGNPVPPSLQILLGKALLLIDWSAGLSGLRHFLEILILCLGAKSSSNFFHSNHLDLASPYLLKHIFSCQCSLYLCIENYKRLCH